MLLDCLEVLVPVTQPVRCLHLSMYALHGFKPNDCLVVFSISEGHGYEMPVGPTDTPCVCNTVTYNMYAACAYCQLGDEGGINASVVHQLDHSSHSKVKLIQLFRFYEELLRYQWIQPE